MIGALIYSVEIGVLTRPDDGEAGSTGAAGRPLTVRYCDVCRRWGVVGSTHICWRNWRPRLSDLLLELDTVRS
jgi:hypothetical protein